MNLVIITSAILAKSFFTPEERLKQTLDTINSVKKHISQPIIYIVEDTDISKTHFYDKLTEEVDTVLIFDQKFSRKRPGVYFGLNKSIGEADLIIYGLTYFLGTCKTFKNIYKISGRYFLTDEYDDSKMVDNMYNFLYKIYPERMNLQVYQTYFYRVPACFLNDYIHLLENIPDLVVSLDTDIETVFCCKINRNHVNRLERLHCRGFLSVSGEIIEE